MTIDLAALAGAEITLVFLVFARIGGALMLLPGFGETHVPPRLRLAAALVLSLAASTALSGPAAGLSEAPAALARALLSEITIGLTLGLLARLMLLALHVAGSVIAQQAALGQIMPSGLAAEGAPAIGNLLLLAGLSLVFGLDLHLALLHALKESYQVFPLGRPPVIAELAEAVTATVSNAFALGLRLATPFVLIGFVTQVGLGIVNRAMPAFMVYMIAAPGVTLLGLVVLIAVLPALLLAWATGFETALEAG